MQNFDTEMATLKNLLQTSKNFSDVVDYFFTNLTERSPAFMQAGKRAKHPLIRKTVELIGTQILQKEVTVSHLILLKLSKYHFYHGSCFIEGNMCNILYFEDIDMGMVGISNLSSDYVHFTRFTCFRVKGMDESSMPAPGSSKLN
jgi:hypothetical protein